MQITSLNWFSIFLGYVIFIAFYSVVIYQSNRSANSPSIVNLKALHLNESISGLKIKCSPADVSCAASQAAGLYHDSRALHQKLNKTILVVASNWAFSELLFNWICRARLFNLKFLVVAIDFRVYDTITRLGYPSVFYEQG